MPERDADPAALPTALSRLGTPARWTLLVALSAALAALLELAHLPAALLLGPMLAGIALEFGGGPVRVPPAGMAFAQGVVGCLIARAITTPILLTFAARWPLFLAVVSFTLLAGLGLGWLIAKMRILPGTTGVWGMLPGAASAMVLMAEAFGADFRLVAFMQYLRVALLAVTASLIGRFWAPETGTAGTAPSIDWFPALAWPAFGITLALVGAGMLAARHLRIPAGGLLVPMGLGIALHVARPDALQLPPWFLAAGYAMLGWNIGLRFTRPVLAAAARALPQTLASIVALMILCAGVAGVLVAELHVDPLSAYLATSPGGLDTVAIIAASTPVDVPFVLALQTVRFFFILLAGPWVSRRVARRLAQA
jgi:membrane AbrB-like protein